MNMTQTFLMAVAIVVLSAGCASDGSQLKNPRHQRPISHKLSVATQPLYWQTRGEAAGQKLEPLKFVIAEDIEKKTG